MDEQEIIEGLKALCICKGVKKRVFVDYVANGVRNLEELQLLTEAGTGSCQGKRCTPKIVALLERRKRKR